MINNPQANSFQSNSNQANNSLYYSRGGMLGNTASNYIPRTADFSSFGK